MHPSLTAIFNEFAGKEVAVKKFLQASWTDHKTGKKEEMYSFAPVDGEPTVKALKEAVERQGMTLRLWFPGMAGTMELRTNRVNGYVEKAADGKYRILNKFDIG